MKENLVPYKKCVKSFTAKVPGSKSLTNRAIIVALLCDKPVFLKGVLDSEDTQLAKNASVTLGAKITIQPDGWLIDGSEFGKNISDKTELFMGNSGTTVRFMSSVLCAKGISCKISGSARMHKRPITLLIDALNSLGSDIVSEKGTGCPPLILGSKKIEGGKVSLSGQVSSQYFSGLMLATPLAPKDSVISVSDTWLSLPYIKMTQQMLEAFSIKMTLLEKSILVAGGQSYKSPGTYLIEPDASAATYPLALGALHGVPVTIEGLGKKSLQGDVGFSEVLQKMGCELIVEDHQILLKKSSQLKAIQLDLNEIPDAAMTVAVLCSVADGVSHLTGLKNLAYKECDRLKALETELNKMGANVVANDDGFTITGVSISSLKPAKIETYKDHRIAMCLSLLGTLVEGTVILDPNCVEKTYPEYWNDLNTWLG